jgi:hypothetical protein
MNRKPIIFIAVLLLSINVFGQNQNTSTNHTQNLLNGTDNNELRINLLMSISGLPELTYERYIADNMGVGLSAAISLDKFENQSTRSIILPYYRVYFGSKKASGFFIEGNMAVVGQKELYNTYDYYSYSNYSYYSSSYSTKSTTNFGLGAAVGAKFLTRNNFLGEVYLGVGRLFGESILSAYPRVGISLGKRF